MRLCSACNLENLYYFFFIIALLLQTEPKLGFFPLFSHHPMPLPVSTPKMHLAQESIILLSLKKTIFFKWMSTKNDSFVPLALCVGWTVPTTAKFNVNNHQQKWIVALNFFLFLFFNFHCHDKWHSSHFVLLIIIPLHTDWVAQQQQQETNKKKASF